MAWQYDGGLTSDGLEAHQLATQPSIVMTEPSPGHFDFDVRGQAIARARAVCEEATEWQEAAPDAAVLAAVVATARAGVEAARSEPWEQVRFSGTPAEVLQKLAGRLDPYGGGEITGDRLLSVWRVTEHAFRHVIVRIRSRIEAVARPAEPGMTTLSIRANLQYLGANDDGDTGWVDADASAVVDHAWAVAARHLAPMVTTLPDEVPQAFGGDVRAAPDLPAPIDPGVGEYRIYAHLLVPPTKPDGRQWDFHEGVAPLVRSAPTIARMGKAVMTGGFALVVDFVDMVYAEYGEQRNPNPTLRRFENMLAERAAAEIVGRVAPDLTLLFSVPQRLANGQVQWTPAYQFPVVSDTTAALWAPIPVQLSGAPFVISWYAEDRDIFQNDPIAQGTVDLLEVVRSCEHTTVGDPNYGELRLIAERVR